MAAIIPPAKLPMPPKPLAPDIKLMQPDGTPTRDFHTFLTQVFEWQNKLRTLLTSDPIP
jgi:hypothetical protein